MDVNQEWTDEFIAELDKTIQRGNTDALTLELMKELIKGAKAKARVSMIDYFNKQED